MCEDESAKVGRVRVIITTPPAICAQTDLRNLVRSGSVDLFAEHALFIYVYWRLVL